MHVAILGEGLTSRSHRREEADAAELETLHARCREVATMLGATGHSLHDLPDNRFDTVPLLDVVRIVEELVHATAPAVVLTHHGGDLNIDHVVTHRAVLTATRPVGDGAGVRQVLAFEVGSSTEWAFDQLAPFRPSVFVDVEATLERKVEAMEAYESERPRVPASAVAGGDPGDGPAMGSAAGRRAAEAFALIRSIC